MTAIFLTDVFHKTHAHRTSISIVAEITLLQILRIIHELHRKFQSAYWFMIWFENSIHRKLWTCGTGLLSI